MKWWIFFLCLCLPLTANAQFKKGILQWVRKSGVSSPMQQNLQRSLARTRLSNFSQPHAISKFILTPPPAVSEQPVLQENLVLSPLQKKDWLDNYHQTWGHFEQLKKDFSSLLFYQSVPLEARDISAQEKSIWLNKMIPLYHRALALYLNTRQDPALQYMLDYLRYGVSMIDPFLTPALPTFTKPYAAPFDFDKFCLYPQEPLPEPGVDLENKHIVIVNDDNSLLEHFEHLSHIGVLFPGAQLHTQGDAMQFLLWAARTNTPPDIVFTDIQLGESNGYYIAHRLRSQGYKGGIIALTSYEQTENFTRQLAQAGFDGMVSLDDRYYTKTPFFLRITQAAQVYLRNKANLK